MIVDINKKYMFNQTFDVNNFSRNEILVTNFWIFDFFLLSPIDINKCVTIDLNPGQRILTTNKC